MRLLRRALTVPVPPASRGAFARDVPALAARTVMMALLGSVGAQLVLKLGGGETHVAFLRSAPHLGLLLSLGWVSLGRGRSPLAMMAAPELLSRLLLVGVAFAVGSAGVTAATLFTIIAASASVLGGLALPFLTTVYGIVYPAEVRARIVAFGRMVSGMVAIVAAWGLGALYEAVPDAHRWTYPILGLAAAVATWRFCTMPVASARQRSASRAVSAWQVIRHDRAFRRFQLFQFMLGFANHAAIPVIDVFVREELGLPIDLAVFVVNQGVVTQLCILLTVRYHGGLFDRLGVVKHRVLTSSLIGFAFLAWAFADDMGWGVLAALLMGLGMAGGQIIWIIGSLSFAPKERFSTYNGIHSFLTGVRGVSAPLLGVLVLRSPLVDGDYRLYFLGIAALVFLSVLGHAFFVRLPERGAGPTS